MSLDTQEFRRDGFRVTGPTKSPSNPLELDPQVAAVLEAAGGCPYRASKITEAVVLALRPLANGTPPTFSPLKLVDQYLVTCGTALVDNLKTAPAAKPIDHNHILLLASLLEQTDTNDVLNSTDHATALLNHPQFQQLLK